MLEEALGGKLPSLECSRALFTDEAVLGQQGLMCIAGVLAAAIRMHDQSRSRLALRDGQLQCPVHQRGLHVRRHRPARHLARVQVQHDRQIQPAAARSDVSDVGHPRLVGPRRVELPVQHIGRNRQRMFAVGRLHELALPH